ncbi:MAG: hypothetical protein AB8G16_12675 [Gammaproteobacteria bacterium]
MEIKHRISRKKAGASAVSFASLREEGIRLTQQTSGDVWSDYNLHDPGVTILEQLCYALTDLVYRSDFSVEDQLAGDDGKIDYTAQALHLPEAVFPCRPWNVDDYLQYLLDTTPDADNIWFEEHSEMSGSAGAGIADDPRLTASCAGLYVANVRLRDEEARDSVGAEIKTNFARQRNLCEDVHDNVMVLESLNCDLAGVIEIDGLHAPGDVLGQIYYAAVAYIASNVRVNAQSESSDVAPELMDLFDGPLVAHDRVTRDGNSNPDSVMLSTLVGILQEVPGVVRIENIRIVTGSGDSAVVHSETVARRHGNKALWLNVPKPKVASKAQPQNGHRLILRKNEREIEYADSAAWHKFYQLITAAHEARRKRINVADAYDQPTGVPRDFSTFHSIRHHFPETYGIGDRGLRASESPERRAQAQQLRAYLLLFEQIMANHLANVDNIRVLFASAVERIVGPTYAVQLLDDAVGEQAPIVDRSIDFLRAVIARFDRAAERRSRQLDHMMAVFGERFSQKSLRHFDQYSTTPDQMQAVVANKAAFLEQIVKITRDRVGGFNYLSADSSGGFMQRVCLLLGFCTTRESRVETLRSINVRPRSCAADENLSSPVTENADAMNLFQDSGYAALLLTYGTQRENYYRAPATTGRAADIFLHAGRDRQAVRIWTCPDGETADATVQRLQQRAIALCRCSEGVHVLEHVLLRPCGGERAHLNGDEGRRCPGSIEKVDLWRAFYALRFSAFFPDWTARCSDPAFRELAQETININSPAHVYGQCFWLDFEQMSQFESLFSRWKREREKAHPEPACLDRAAWCLIEFCVACASERQRG